MTTVNSTMSPAGLQAILDSPVMPPPPGWTASLDQSSANLVRTSFLIAMLVIISTSSVAIACFTKIHIIKKPNWADRE